MSHSFIHGPTFQGQGKLRYCLRLGTLHRGLANLVILNKSAVSAVNTLILIYELIIASIYENRI